MKLDSMCFHCQRLEGDMQVRATNRPTMLCKEAKGTNGIPRALSLTRAKGVNLVEKEKGGKGVLPKFLLGRDNTNMDFHGRRLCFNFQIGKCSEAADGAECPRGWHLCCRRGCFAPHAEKDHDGKKK